MKKFMKKTNRGIILTAIVLSILSIYVSADYAAFQTQKDTIKQNVSDYMTKIYEANTNNSGTDKEKLDAILNLISTYWTDSSDSNTDGVTRSLMEKNASYMFDNPTPLVHDISQTSFNINSMSVSKSGPGYALVTIEYQVTAKGMDNSFLLTPSSLRLLSDMYSVYVTYSDFVSYEDSNANANNESSDDYEGEYKLDLKNPKSGTLQYNATASIELVREKDSWKICNISGLQDSGSFDNNGRD